MTLTRDLVRQGHVTLQVTYLISGPIHARDMNFFCFHGFLGQESQWHVRARYVTLTRDLVRQGHVTLQVTYLISGPIHARDLIFFCFHGLLGQESQWHVSQIRDLDA